MTDTGSKVVNKPPAGTAAVVRRDPDEERRRTKQGLVRERAPRPPGGSFGGELPAFSLAVGRDAMEPPTDEDRDLEQAAPRAPRPEPASLAPASALAPVSALVAASALPSTSAATPAPAPTPVGALAAPAGLLDLSQPGDRLEREADEAAERVVRRLAVAPGGAAGDAASPRPPEPPPAYARSLLVQRASLVEVVAESAGLVPRLDSPGGLIVDDRAETLSPGQMKKTPFLAQLREIACETAERELRRAGRSAQGCPYLEEILGRFARRAPDQLERSIRRYAPEARTATRARDYLPPVATRLGQGIATWVRTGRMPDNLPDEFRPGRLSDFLEVGASLGRAARALFKGKSGAAGRGNIDASALAGQLGPGRPLDGSARTRMESAFGHPFGDVRVHADDRAAALSRELEARAFTLGSHVAFGAGEFHPGTPVGDALLAHELAHVVQQRGAAPSTGLPAGNASDTLERDADHAAVGAVGFLARLARGVRGARSPQGPRQRGGLRLSRCPRSAPKTPEAGPAMYDTTQHTIIRLPDGRTVAAMEDNLRYERANGNITSWKAEDVFPGSNEQLYILYAIWQLSHTKSWDREVDLITEIGPSQRGAITVRIDARGNAVGTLISDREPKVAATYKTFDEAVKGLKAKYKLSDIRDENKVWSDDDPAKAVEKRKKAVDELNKVAAAWSKLSPAEAAALEGYALIRTDTLTGPDGKPAAGLTTTGDVIAPDRLSSTRQREIRFADLAFAGDAVSFVGDTENAAPASADTILHEAGHAQERKAKVDAESAHVEAEMATNVADKQYSDQHQKASDTMTAAEASVSKLNRTKRAASKGYVDAFRAAFDAIDAPTAEQDPTKVAALLQAADAAVQARNTARDALKDGPAVAAYATALTEQDALLAAVKALMAARQTVDTAEASQTAARDPTGTQSARVQRFVDFVNTKGIKPFTDYAKRNWPAHPGEFYAEAFALWHADPKFLASSFPELKKWFDAGEHLKWSARSSSRWLRGAQGPPRRRP